MEWDVADIKNLARFLRGVSAIDFTTSSPNAQAMWLSFSSVWEDYLHSHPELKAQIDPVYVVAKLVPGQPAPEWPPVPVGFPMNFVEHDGASYAWVFDDQISASFWAGIVRAKIPELRVWMFTCANPCITW